MTITMTHLGVASSNSTSVTLGAAGDLAVATVDWVVAPTSIANSGSPLSWQIRNLGSWSGFGSYTYTAVVTAAAAGSTVTVTVTGGTVDFLLVDNLSAGYGALTKWAFPGSSATNPVASATVTFPNLTTGATGLQCYYGTCWVAQTLSDGATPVNGAAFSYSFYDSDIGVAFSSAVASSTAYQPTATAASSTTNAANALTISATSGAGLLVLL